MRTDKAEQENSVMQTFENGDGGIIVKGFSGGELAEILNQNQQIISEL
jgi:hypothetical protein